MKTFRIALTGGGTGGHVFPLSAVADALARLGGDAVAFHYYGPKSDWNAALTARGIPVTQLAGSKLRRYFSFQNVIDVPKFFWSLFRALISLYFWMPDAVFSKGGPGALAVVLAAAWYRIPVVVHESDAIPGLTNRISAKFAKKVCIAFRNAAEYFPERKLIFAGNPVRESILTLRLERSGAKSRLGLDMETPLLLVLGGSQGARALNEFVERTLPMLTPTMQILHQTGKGNASSVTGVPGGNARYRAQEFLNEEEMAAALRAADLVLSRAGGSAIYECAAVGTPAILVPLPQGANDHQRANAREYAEAGAAIVLEENNLTPNLASGEIRKLLADEVRRKEMGERAKAFFKPDAAETVARAVIAAAGATIV